MLETARATDERLPRRPTPGQPGQGCWRRCCCYSPSSSTCTICCLRRLSSPPLNDDVLHLLALEGTASALAAGQNPTDFWLGAISLGYPLFHHYQHLAYLPLAALHRLSGGALSRRRCSAGRSICC